MTHVMGANASYVSVSDPVRAGSRSPHFVKRLQEYRSDKFDTIIIQGNQSETKDVYHYTNGQLVFDRQVRLGSDMLNPLPDRYWQRLDISSVRIVLSEKC